MYSPKVMSEIESFVVEREVLTLAEAADFLRLSVSTMHQRRDIPRHRVPGSRGYRYLRCELLAWLKGEPKAPEVMNHERAEADGSGSMVQPVVDISSRPLYHRSAIYR
jgi:hypothetical protein